MLNLTSYVHPRGYFLLQAHCPAKINLFLEVQGKRADGMHNLGTLFQSLEIGDDLTVEPAVGITLMCNEKITPDPDDNLVVRAARLVKESYSPKVSDEQGARFTLTKRLPMGAGLGGGSSNAAAALRLCNQLWRLQLTDDELFPMAAKLGADVPFFLMQGCFFGEGKGEILKPAPEPFPFHVVVGTPFCSVETAWAYQQLPPKTEFSWPRFKALYMTHSDNPGFYRMLRNDFEVPMRSRHPEIERLFEAMEALNPVKSLLSGSGASVFALFEDQAAAQRCLEGISPLCRFACLTHFQL